MKTALAILLAMVVGSAAASAIPAKAGEVPPPFVVAKLCYGTSKAVRTICCQPDPPAWCKG